MKSVDSYEALVVQALSMWCRTPFNERADVKQECFLALLEAEEPVDDPDPYVLAVCHSAITGENRRHSAFTKHAPPVVQPENIEFPALEPFIVRLTEEEQYIVRAYYGGVSMRAVARRQGVTTAQAKEKLQKSLENLRTLLALDSGEEEK